MSSRVIDEEFEDPTADELWDFNDNLPGETIPEEEELVEPVEGDPELEDVVQTAPNGRDSSRKRHVTADGDTQNDSVDDSPPSWRVIEMRREQRDLDDFLKEVYDE